MPPRRVSLPGADELFRTTGGMALSPSLGRPAEAPRTETARDAGAAAADVPQACPEQHAGPADGSTGGRQHSNAAEEQQGEAARRARPRGRAPRRPSGRERHDEKITVYVSAEELMDLEHARLVLRGEHGLAVDRGRVVREAIAVVLADLEQRGEASILVRRLRGR
ncbi:hypothetical protein GCM10010193_17160 [Kitasatospora atroaurantiaca]|uniref:Cobyrinic acid a,c-diamide synthase n=1 Tax=Kitasatospora atroaurantiaca TaxID=285545 RepID=A0A561EX93_9ACTN|nr:hypothetical protein FB465_5375 [Kitasatospora atroaurantiaca]